MYPQPPDPPCHRTDCTDPCHCGAHEVPVHHVVARMHEPKE